MPSPLRFSDLKYDPLGKDTDIRPGIGIDRRRRTVQEHLLFLTETVVAGAEFSRCGPAICGQASREEGLLLLAGLQAIQSWGGARSRGLGWAVVIAKATLDGDPLDLQKEKEVLAQWLTAHRS
jgi:CRISPR/Cas system CSM-associated protein Csm3 (group 7 of RAMP superfamily)